MGGSHHGLSWAVEDQQGMTVVRLSGELDLTAADALNEALNPLIARATTLILDCEALTFMDSTGIRVLARTKQGSDDLGGRVMLARPSPVVRRVLDVAGLMDYFEFVEGPPGPG